MIYIFEDKADDLISLLFKAGYDKETASKFVYAKGNGYLISEAQKRLMNSNEKVCVFIDMVPDNKELHKIYSGLKRLSLQYPNRLIVMPIICAEYYLVKALEKEPVMKSHIGVSICLNKEVYYNSPLISEPDDKKFCKTFEKYCKLILLKNLEDCAKHSRGQNAENKMYSVYYTSDCICSKSLDKCRQKNLLDKALSFLSNYPCVPENSLSPVKNKLSESDIIDIHRKLVDEFNSVVQKYKTYDPSNVAEYKTINYIM